MRTVTVLHLSDIHRTPDEAVSTDELLLWLTRDLSDHASEEIPRPDIVVVSGDLTQAATPTEYEEAARFLEGLLAHLQLAKDRLVIVPGNHDVDWASCDDHYRMGPRAQGVPDVSVTRNGVMFGFESEETYQRRFENFRAFYDGLLGVRYPAERGRQWTFHRLDALGITIVGFNSCDRLHRHKNEASISDAAILQARSALDGISNSWRLGVWHHDVDWRGDSGPGCLSPDSLRALSTASLDLGLCGHTHRPLSRDAVLVDGYALPTVAAGSLCAGGQQRPEGEHRSYNVVRLQAEDSTARVWVRVKKTRSAPWRDAAEFGPRNARRSWFDVPIRGGASAPIGTASADSHIAATTGWTEFESRRRPIS